MLQTINDRVRQMLPTTADVKPSTAAKVNGREVTIPDDVKVKIFTDSQPSTSGLTSPTTGKRKANSKPDNSEAGAKKTRLDNRKPSLDKINSLRPSERRDKVCTFLKQEIDKLKDLDNDKTLKDPDTHLKIQTAEILLDHINNPKTDKENQDAKIKYMQYLVAKDAATARNNYSYMPEPPPEQKALPSAHGQGQPEQQYNMSYDLSAMQFYMIEAVRAGQDRHFTPREVASILDFCHKLENKYDAPFALENNHDDPLAITWPYNDTPTTQPTETWKPLSFFSWKNNDTPTTQPNETLNSKPKSLLREGVSDALRAGGSALTGLVGAAATATASGVVAPALLLGFGGACCYFGGRSVYKLSTTAFHKASDYYSDRTTSTTLDESKKST
ncbi:MAG: hypothetical protein QS748_00880 [Candidatus Endonucleobacter bathymodioli]|uniref:Uncharacterized protein n=1 Tax=Candidatus Endonucleibacter bathymodioli TaxID=539814 RepID=A0AA90NP29_9GAMM|nr:hypothetical protein [Candidatus Endonucleobacter bathymodioli]